MGYGRTQCKFSLYFDGQGSSNVSLTCSWTFHFFPRRCKLFKCNCPVRTDTQNQELFLPFLFIFTENWNLINRDWTIDLQKNECLVIFIKKNKPKQNKPQEKKTTKHFWWSIVCFFLSFLFSFASTYFNIIQQNK